MLEALTRGIVRRPRLVLAVWALVVVVSLLGALGVGGTGLFDRLHSGEPSIPGTESQEGRELLEESEEQGEQVTLLVRGVDVSDPATAEGTAAALAPLRQEIAALPGVASVLDPFLLADGPANPDAAPLVAGDSDGFLVIVEMAPHGQEGEAASEAKSHREAVEAQLDELPADLAAAVPGADGIVSSEALLTAAITDQVQADLITGEAVALPLSLAVMVLVFGGFLAAGLPLVAALASIGSGLGMLLLLTQVMTVDSVVVNVVSVLGLGLSIDYALLLVSRFREELRETVPDEPAGRRRRRRRGADPEVVAAVQRTLATAGRTVAFSAVTIAVVVAALLLMRPDILQAIGAGSAGIVVIALAAALTLVPALLMVLGPRLRREPLLARVPGLRRIAGRLGEAAPVEGVFSRLANRVHDHPWFVLVGVLAVLGLLASPIAGLQLRSSTTDLLPPSSDQREFVAELAELYPAAATPDVLVVADAEAERAAAWAAEIAQLSDVTDAALTGTSPDGEHTVIAVTVASSDPGGEAATGVVDAVRDLDPGFDTWVMGQAAGQADFIGAVADGLPLLVPLVFVVIFVLLFAMTGSVLIPLKAIIVNVLGLTASLGVTVWVFQEGHLDGLLGFTPVGGLEVYVVAIVVAFGFGLAMDYEMFLLARIKEFWDAGHDNDTAVARGLQQSGRIITSAALVIALVFLGFVAGELMVIKQVGFALAITVAVDATLVRMLLVPATMTLLGRWNWWAPQPLARLQQRLMGRGHTASGHTATEATATAQAP